MAEANVVGKVFRARLRLGVMLYLLNPPSSASEICFFISKINGSTVLAQYPKENSTLISKQRVMLLMGSSDYEMPDMRGWSRKEVTAFWELTGIEIIMEGSGYVTEQNISPGDLVNNSTQIIVKLQ